MRGEASGTGRIGFAWGAVLALGVGLLGGGVQGCVAAPLQAPSASGAVHPAGEVSANTLFVMIQGDARIALVDMDALEVREVIELSELGFGARSMPHHVAVSPRGDHWYVSLIGENRVLRFDPENRITGSFEMETPGMLSLTPSGRRLAVSRSMSAVNPPARIGFVDPGEGIPVEVDVLFPRPHGIVVDGDGRYAYTASLGLNQIASVDLETERVEIVDVPGPTHAFVQLALSPDGSTLVATGEMSGELVAFDLTDPARPRPAASIQVGPQAFDPAFHPRDGTVWVPIKGADEIAIVDPNGWTVTRRIDGAGLSQPHAISFSPDGSRAFVTNNAADPGLRAGSSAGSEGAAALVVVNTATLEIEATLELGRNLTGLGSRPES